MMENGILSEAKLVLQKLKNAIKTLSDKEFVASIDLLDNSSIGEHSRHIIEFFQCLINGYNEGIVNYDNRKRNISIQTNIAKAIQTIAKVSNQIHKDDKPLKVTTLYNNNHTIDTTYYRELLFNTEHCIHHLAMIKVGLAQLMKENIDKNLGVAKSTLLYKKNVYG